MIKIEPMVASFCPKCKMSWYYPIDMPDNEKKQICGYKGCDGKITHTKITAKEHVYIENISEDHEFLSKMNDLRNSDIVAFKEKIAEYIIIYNQTNKPLPEDDTYIPNKPKTVQQPKCPTCGSTNIEKISAGKKIKGSMLFGIFSSDVRKTMHCKNCGYKW